MLKRIPTLLKLQTHYLMYFIDNSLEKYVIRNGYTLHCPSDAKMPNERENHANCSDYFDYS